MDNKLFLCGTLAIFVTLFGHINGYGPVILQAGSPCSGDTYAPDPYVCSQYLQCNQGAFIRRPCGPGTVWNARINTCDHPSRSLCVTPLANRQIGVLRQYPLQRLPYQQQQYRQPYQRQGPYNQRRIPYQQNQQYNPQYRPVRTVLRGQNWYPDGRDYDLYGNDVPSEYVK